MALLSGRDLIEETFTDLGVRLKCKLCPNFEREYPFTDESARFAASEFFGHCKDKHADQWSAIKSIVAMEAHR